MYVKRDFILIFKDVWLETMVEGTEWYSLCWRYRWLRKVIPVNWPEKAGLFSMQSLWELKCCLGSQMSKWDLVQEKQCNGSCPLHCSNVMDLGRQTRVPFKEQLWFMYFSGTQFSNPEETEPSSPGLCLLFSLKCGFCEFWAATRGQQRNR